MVYCQQYCEAWGTSVCVCVFGGMCMFMCMRPDVLHMGCASWCMSIDTHPAYIGRHSRQAGRAGRQTDRQAVRQAAAAKYPGTCLSLCRPLVPNPTTSQADQALDKVQGLGQQQQPLWQATGCGGVGWSGRS